MTPEAIRGQLVWRIVGDPTYAKRRLGYIPTLGKVSDAIAASVNTDEVAQRVAELLDEFESAVWDELLVGLEPHA